MLSDRTQAPTGAGPQRGEEREEEEPSVALGWRWGLAHGHKQGRRNL